MGSGIEHDARFLRNAAAYLRSRGVRNPRTTVVLGSGLGGVARLLDRPVVISTSEIPGYPSSTVPGHAGRIFYGSVRSPNSRPRPVLVFQGRIHPYEGGNPADPSLNMRLSHHLGARTAILTNAAGGIRSGLHVGDLMLHSSIMSLPTRLSVLNRNMRFMRPRRFATATYDAAMNRHIQRWGEEVGLRISLGTYCYVSGPSYETPAEVRMLAAVGADAVGMSTYPEVAEATALGMRVSAISLISNEASGLSQTPLSHEEVSRAGRKADREVSALLARVLAGGFSGSR